MLTRTYLSDRMKQRKPVTVAVDGARLRELRLSLGLSQQQVGDAVGRTKAWVGQVEMGKTMPGVDAALALRDFYGIAAMDTGALVIS